MAQPDDELTLHEVAARLGVHYNTVYRYVRRGKLEARQVGGEWRVAPEALDALTDTTKPTGKRGEQNFDLLQERMLRRLIAGDVEGSWDIATDCLDAGAEPTEVHTKVLGPAMAEIGERWSRGELEVQDEHRATAVTNLLLGRLSTRFRRRGRRRGRVVLGAAPGDQHSLAVAMMADILRANGFEAIDLGADVPAASFASVVQDADQLVAVAIYSGAPDNATAVADSVDAIRSAVPGYVRIILGGPGVGGATRAEALGAHEWAGSAEDVLRAVEAATNELPRAQAC
ncbi:MAG: B12-binding domain-containing protein [Actinomycetota bacterium]